MSLALVLLLLAVVTAVHSQCANPMFAFVRQLPSAIGKSQNDGASTKEGHKAKPRRRHFASAAVQTCHAFVRLVPWKIVRNTFLVR